MTTPALSVQTEFTVVPAKSSHAPSITRLVNSWAERKLMLRREAREVRGMIGQFHVAVATPQGVATHQNLAHASHVVGCGALTPYSAEIAEIRSLCVDATFHGSGVGTGVTLSLLAAAAEHGHSRVLAVTKSPAFFTRLGFRVLTAEEYPADFLDHGIRAHKRTLKGKYVVSIDAAPRA